MKYVSKDSSKSLYHTDENCSLIGEYEEKETLDPRYPWRECEICQRRKFDVIELE